MVCLNTVSRTLFKYDLKIKMVHIDVQILSNTFLRVDEQVIEICSLFMRDISDLSVKSYNNV